MKKILVVCILICNVATTVRASSSLPLAMFDNIIGYQQGVGFSSPMSRPSFDVNTSWYLCNIAYSYQRDFGSSLYVGVGFFCFAQLQYGYTLDRSAHNIKVRSDIPIWLLVDKNIPLSLGLFYEYSFAHGRGSTIGLSISINFATIINRYGTSLVGITPFGQRL